MFNEYFTPHADVSQDKSSYTIKIELPGVKKEDISVEVEGDSLVISAKRDSKEYSRSFRIPGSVDTSCIDGRSEDGILTLTLPKRKPPKKDSHKINIK